MTPLDPTLNLPLILYIHDIAAVLRRSRRSVERLRHSKRLPDELHIPGRPCWSRDDFLAWLNSGGRRK
jgi:hypothetical protein